MYKYVKDRKYRKLTNLSIRTMIQIFIKIFYKNHANIKNIIHCKNHNNYGYGHSSIVSQIQA